MYLDNDQILKICNNDFEILDLDLNQINKTFQYVDVEIEKAEIGDYDSFMLKEIMEQPISLRQSMLGRIKNNNITLGGIQEHVNNIIKCKRIIIIGCGTSYHAGLIIEYFF